LQGGHHPRRLLGGEHKHICVVHIVHEVHEHVTVRAVVAGYSGEHGRPTIRSLLVRRICDLITVRASTVWVSDMVQVQVMPQLVGPSLSPTEKRQAAPAP
jgi:hypothetical protein